ncbi:MAG: MFS transporter [Gammaproteobacteria bacterium]
MRIIKIQAQLWPLQFFLLMLSVFNVFVGYGIALPVLPFLLQDRYAGVVDFSVAWHTGMMTGVFMITLFLFAPLWGKLSDRLGRRPVILIGLGGCVVALMAFALVETLWLGYFTRALGGAVVSAVLPVALAYVSDISSPELRARRFAWISAAATLGFLVGPGVGGWINGSDLATNNVVDATALPFLLGSIAGLIIWIVVLFGLSESTSLSMQSLNKTDKQFLPVTAVNSLIFLAILGMFGLGSFEVSLALQGQQLLNLTSFQIGMLFMVCSLMMVIVQVLLFSILAHTFSFRYIITTALLTMSAGLGLIPFAVGFNMVLFATALVGIGSGVLIPLLAYQTSLNAGNVQGAALGKQTAAGGLGQGLGSIMAGALFGFASQTPFWFTAILLAGGALIGLRITRQPI